MWLGLLSYMSSHNEIKILRYSKLSIQHSGQIGMTWADRHDQVKVSSWTIRLYINEIQGSGSEPV